MLSWYFNQGYVCFCLFVCSFLLRFSWGFPYQDGCFHILKNRALRLNCSFFCVLEQKILSVSPCILILLPCRSRGLPCHIQPFLGDSAFIKTYQPHPSLSWLYKSMCWLLIGPFSRYSHFYFCTKPKPHCFCFPTLKLLFWIQFV